MSHFTTLKTKIMDLDVLEQALVRLQRPYRRAKGGKGGKGGKGIEVRGYQGATTKAELVINYGKYDVGLTKEPDGSYTLVADWWGIQNTAGLSERQVAEAINQEYALVRVWFLCQKQGYSIRPEDIQRDETGNLVVTACKLTPKGR